MNVRILIIKSNKDGNIVRLKDIADVHLGSEVYEFNLQWTPFSCCDLENKLMVVMLVTLLSPR